MPFLDKEGLAHFWNQIIARLNRYETTENARLKLEEAKSYTDNSIPTKVTDLENDAEYITADALSDLGGGDMLKATYDKDGDGVVDDAEKLGGVAASEYAKKTDIPTVPTNVGAFTNDAGYLTSYTETDPTVPSHVKSITTGDISNWNAKATTSYVDTKVAGIVDTAPEALDTLNELAAALGDDPNFATTVMTEIGKKVDKTTTVNGHTLSGNVTITSVEHATSADSATAAITATSAIQDSDGRNIVNTYATKNELNGKAQRISLTNQCQTRDYTTSVIALCYAPTTAEDDFGSHSVGTISMTRVNGLYPPCVVNISMVASHGAVGKIITQYTRTQFQIFEACTFTYNGVSYGGIKVKPSDASASYVEFIGYTSFPIFALDIHRADTGEILNEEVYNSISSSTVLIENDLYSGGDEFITSGNIASQSVASATTAGHATKATQDGNGNTIATYYMKRGIYERIEGTSSAHKNLNDYTTAGFYTVKTAHVDNCPSGIGIDAVLLVYQWDSSGYECQEITESAASTTARRWIRHKNGSTWTAWVEMVTSDNIGSQSVNHATTADSANQVLVNRSGSDTYFPIILTNSGDGTTSKVDSIYASTNNTVTMNPATGAVKAANFEGNASSATKLATARNINGVAFDGTSDVTVYSPQDFAPLYSSLSTAGWYRIAEIAANNAFSCRLDIGTIYATTVPEVVTLNITKRYGTECNITQINHAGSVSIIPKIRAVQKSGETWYLEMYYDKNTSNAIYCSFTNVTGLKGSGVALGQHLSTVNFTAGEIPEGYTATEFALSTKSIKAPSIEAESIFSSNAAENKVGVTHATGELYLWGNAETGTRGLYDGGESKYVIQHDNGNYIFHGSLNGDADSANSVACQDITAAPTTTTAGSYPVSITQSFKIGDITFPQYAKGMFIYPAGGDATLTVVDTSGHIYTAYRNGTTWQGPRIMVDSGNISSQSVNYAASAGGVAWGNVSGKPSFATVATTGNYGDLIGRPSIPAAANNGTLTIQKNGTTVATFGANQSTNATANITVPTKVSELTNDSGFKTTDNNTTYTVATGDSNGQIKVTPSSGSAYNVSVKGLGSAAYTASTAYATAGHTHTKSQITDFPTSMPASDVYSWAKASTKPSYSWGEITGKPSTFTPASHTHAASEISGCRDISYSCSISGEMGSLSPGRDFNVIDTGNSLRVLLQNPYEGWDLSFSTTDSLVRNKQVVQVEYINMSSYQFGHFFGGPGALVGFVSHASAYEWNAFTIYYC